MARPREDRGEVPRSSRFDAVHRLHRLEMPVDVNPADPPLAVQAVVGAPVVGDHRPWEVPTQHTLHHILPPARVELVVGCELRGKAPRPPVRSAHPHGRLVRLHEVRRANLLSDRRVFRTQLLGGELQQTLDLSHAHLQPRHRGEDLLDASHREPHHREEDHRAREARAELAPRKRLVGGPLDVTVASSAPVSMHEDPQDGQVGRDEFGDEALVAVGGPA